MATIFAPDRPALRRTRLRSFNISCGLGGTAGGAEGLDAAVNGSSGLTRDGLVGDSFEESFIGGLQGILVHLKGGRFRNEALQAFVAFGQVISGFGEVKGG